MNFSKELKDSIKKQLLIILRKKIFHHLSMKYMNLQLFLKLQGMEP